LGTTRIKLKKGDDKDEKDNAKITKIRENIERLGIDNLAYFGGNDSADILQALGIGVHGSKTIDNDLGNNGLVHHTPGFASAAWFNSIAVKNLAIDIGSYRVRGRNDKGEECWLVAPVTIYQAMGRDTGWLALATGLARVDRYGKVDPTKAPDIIWPREVPFDQERYLSTLSDILQRQGRAVIVIGEELVNTDGIPLAEVYGRDQTDEHGHAQHGRADSFNYANHLGELAKKRLKVNGVKKVKETPIAPQHIQRSYVKSIVDSEEAFEVGRETVRAILDGNRQVSVVLQKVPGSTYYHMVTARVPLEQIAGKTRYVPPEFIDGIRGPTEAFIREFLPTIGGAKALPHYERLDFSKAVLIN